MGGERQLHEERRTSRGRTAEEGSLVRDGWSESDGHPSAFARAPSPLPSSVRPRPSASVRGPWQIGEGYAGYAIKRGEREREKEEGERRISAWPPCEERSNRCQLGEMREERGDDDGDGDDDERRAAAVGTVLIG